MRYRITGLALLESVAEDPRQLSEALSRVLGVSTVEIIAPEIVKHSLDARRRPARHIWSVEVEVADDAQLRPRPPRGAHIKALDEASRPSARFAPGVLTDTARGDGLPPDFNPVVVGAGPAGMFAALALARMGVPPVLLERGEPIEEREIKVETFWAGADPDPESNVLFGEGGSSAFSDGKIYTRTRDHLVSSVLRELVECGAPSKILIESRPHIGSDVIKTLLVAMRQRLEDLGVEIRYGARVVELLKAGSRIVGVRLADGEELPLSPVLLAPGHSARDSFEMMAAAGVPLESWPSAIGLRIEHSQDFIDRAQYKTEHPRMAGLPPAEYHLAFHCDDGRGVYSFCMCPGGRTIGVSNNPGRLVTNGSGRSNRGSPTASSGVVVQVRPEDYRRFGDPDADPLVGFDYLEHWERAAFELGGGGFVAPAQRVADFVDGRPTSGPLETSYSLGTVPADLRACLPEPVANGIAQALLSFGRRMRGFDGPSAVLLGVETRTSSPVRVLRGPEGRAQDLDGLYPAGEGAGYAGGIVSAAVDGVRVAEWCVKHARG